MGDDRDYKYLYEMALEQRIRFAVKLGDQEELIDELFDFCRDVANNYDCDSDAHKYNTGCRCCKALEMLKKIEDYKLDRPTQVKVGING